jgi:hypothetical protein
MTAKTKPPRQATAAARTADRLDGLISSLNSRSNFRPQLREESDAYPFVVTPLAPGWRLILCCRNTQWIVQHERGKRCGRLRWEGRWYCRTPEGLSRVLRRFLGLGEPLCGAILAGLPGRPAWRGRILAAELGQRVPQRRLAPETGEPPASDRSGVARCPTA